MIELFVRAKRLDNGEWVYWNVFGQFRSKNNTKGARFKLKSEINKAHTSYRDYIAERYDLVDKNTISPYIGLADINKQKIFVGDIVECVLYEDFLIEGKIYRQKMVIEFVGGAFKMRELISSTYYDLSYDGIIDIIGNIYDNPELLRVEDK